MPALAFADEGTATVTFDANGGYFEEYDEQADEWQQFETITKEGQTIGEAMSDIPYDPSWSGHGFEGWSTEKNGETVDIYNYIVEGDTTFYAQWSDYPKAIFDPNGGFVYVENDDEYIESPDPKEGYVYQSGDEYYAAYESAFRTGFRLLGWSLQENGGDIVLSEEDTREYPITEDTTFYAQWEQRSYKITWKAGKDAYFETENGHQDTIVEYTDEYEEAGEPKEISGYHVPIKVVSGKAYVLTGYKDQDGKAISLDDLNEGVSITKDTVLTAQYAEAWMVTFKAGEGRQLKDQYGDFLGDEYIMYVRKGENIDDLPSFVSADESERVSGWLYNGKEVYPEEMTISKNTEFTAVWTSRVKLVLDGMGGTFQYGESTVETWVNQGDEFYEYCTTFTANGERVFREFSSYDPYLEGSAFAGWYTDEGLTEPFTQKEATKEFISSLPDKTLYLYAKYTNDINTLTVDANGGEFNNGKYEGTTAEIKVPAGQAVKLNDLASCENEAGDELRISGWYNKDTNEKIETSEDGYFVPTEDISIYPQWAEPLPDIDLWLSADADTFYLDGDLGFDADITVHEEEGTVDLSTMRYRCSINVYDVTNGGSEDLGQLTPVKVLSDDAYYTWTPDENRILLHGEAIKPELDALGIDKDNLNLELSAEICTDSGEVVAADNRIIFPRDPEVDYRLGFILSDEDDEAITGTDAEVLLGYDELEAYKETWGYVYSSKNPDGDEFEYRITGVSSSDEDVIAVTDRDYCFHLEPKNPGKAVVTISYNDINGEPQTAEYNVTVVGSKYFAWIDGETDDDEDSDMVIRKTVPGGSVEFTAGGNRRTVEEPDGKDGFTFQWSFTDESFADFATITSTGDKKEKAVVKINEDVDPSAIEDGIGIKAELVADEDGKVKASAEAKVNVYSEYYELANIPDEEDIRYTRAEKSVTLTPEVRRYAPDTVGMTGGYAVADDKIMIVNFDEDSVAVSSGEEELSSGDAFTGSITVTRLSDAPGAFDIDVYENGTEDEELASVEYSFTELINLSEAKITVRGLSNMVYTGKARKPIPEEVYVIYTNSEGEEDEENLSYEDGDFSIAYKNNVKVGKATATFTGKRACYGTFSKTFKVNPKGTSISSLSKGKKSFTVKWRKQAVQTSGYQIQYGLKSSFKSAKTKTIKGTKTVKATVKSLKSKKTYYVRVRTYKTVKGFKYYSAWSKASKVKTR